MHIWPFSKVAEQSMRSLETMLALGSVASGASPDPAPASQPAPVNFTPAANGVLPVG